MDKNQILDELIEMWHKTGAWRTLTLEQFLEHLKTNYETKTKSN